MDPTWVLAHQGGWDELLMFGVPIVLAVVGVRFVERRSARRRAAVGPDQGDGDEDGHDGGGSGTSDDTVSGRSPDPTRSQPD